MSTQEKERYYFELFAKTYRLPHGTVEHGDQPDVILRGERTIGIEMRNFFLEEGFLPQSEQVQRKLREEVVAEAQRIYEIKHGRRGDEFVFGFEIPISEKQKLANQIADLADRVVDKQTRQIRRNAYLDIPELSFVYVIPTKYSDARWRVSRVHDGATMSLSRLREIIEEKEKKSRGYKPCDGYWLLAVVDFMDLAQDQEIRIEGLDTVTSSVFEKILIYRTVVEEVVEKNPLRR